MISESKAAALRKSSRNAAVGTALGALIVLAAIVFSVIRLYGLEQEATKLDDQIADKQTTIQKQSSELDLVAKEIEAKQRELERVESWGMLFRICSLAGQIAISRTNEEAELAYTQMDAIKSQIKELAPDEDSEVARNALPLIAAIDELRPSDKNWDVPADRWIEGGVRDQIIDLGNLAKATMSTAPAAIQQFNNELKRVLYDQAISTVRNLYESDAAKWNEEPTKSNRDTFWQLYWGDLVFIESGDFADAMIGIRKSIKDADGKKPEDLRTGLRNLAQSYHDDLNVWPRLPEDLLPQTEN